MAFENNPQIMSTERVGLIHTYPEAASQSFKKGQFVYLASGAVTVVATDGTTIMGIALDDATGTTGSDIHVQIVQPDDVVRIRCRNATSDVTCDNLALGTTYGLVVASNVVYIDKADTTNKALAVERYETDAAGSYTYWIYARVLPTVAQVGVGS